MPGGCISRLTCKRQYGANLHKTNRGSPIRTGPDWTGHFMGIKTPHPVNTALEHGYAVVAIRFV
jgi:hypothetical protein